MLLSPPSTYIQDTGTAKGRGVFSARAYGFGEVVEVCPVVVLNATFSLLPEEIKTLVYDWSVLAKVPNTHALALGYGSMYNHENPANMRYEADSQHSLLRFIAIRVINKGEELTINYNSIGGGPQWDNNNWFERMNIEPIVNG